MKSAIAVELSQNSKIGLCSATYVSQKSCPKSCPWLNFGCYAESGITGIHTKRLNKSNQNNILEIAKEESEAIDSLSGKYDLRLRVVGDCINDEAVKMISDSVNLYLSKKPKISNKVWAYTHYRKTKRESWGNISVLRSCESLRQAETAIKANFGATMIVEKFKSNKAYFIGRNLKGIPCPAQTSKKTCVECRLCLNSDKLVKNNLVILFEAHGTNKNKIIKKLNVLN